MKFFLFLFVFSFSLFGSSSVSLTATYNPLSVKTSSVAVHPTLSCYTQKKINVTPLGYTLQCYDVANDPTSSHYVITHVISGSGKVIDSSSVANSLNVPYYSNYLVKNFPITRIRYPLPPNKGPVYPLSYYSALNTYNTAGYTYSIATSVLPLHNDLLHSMSLQTQTNSLLSSQLGVGSSILFSNLHRNVYLKSIAQSSAYNAFASSSSSNLLNASLKKFASQNHSDLSAIRSDLNSSSVSDVNGSSLSGLKNILLKHDGLKVPSSSLSGLVKSTFDNVKSDFASISSEFNNLKTLFSAKKVYTFPSYSHLNTPSINIFGKNISLNLSAFAKFEPLFYFVFTAMFLWIAIRLFFFGLSFHNKSS